MEKSQYEHLLNELKLLSAKLESPKKAHRSENIEELCAALSKAQQEMDVAGLNKENAYFMIPFSDLVEIVEASRPSLSKNGLCVIQQIMANEEGSSILHTILCHSTGQWIESQMRILPPKNDIQTLGSYITSLKRISYSALIGVVVANEDDDGEAAMANAREIFAKGPSLKQYNPKTESFSTVTKEQLEELEFELADSVDLAEEVMDKLKIQSLADMPKSKYHSSITAVRRIKKLRQEAK